MSNKNLRLAIIGLGYVGLPLAVEFGKKRPVVGFDIDHKRIEELKNGHDSTLEVDVEELKQAQHLSYNSEMDALRDCNTYIVTVPTPIDEHKRPDLTPLIKASESVGKILNKGDIVYELQNYGIHVDVYDPWVNSEEAEKEYKIILLKELNDAQKGRYDAVVLAVAHEQFRQLGSKKLRGMGKKNCLIYDLKYLLEADAADIRL